MTHSFPTRRSSDLGERRRPCPVAAHAHRVADPAYRGEEDHRRDGDENVVESGQEPEMLLVDRRCRAARGDMVPERVRRLRGKGTSRNRSIEIAFRSEEHTSELQSLMRISYAVFCLKKKTKPSTTW